MDLNQTLKNKGFKLTLPRKAVFAEISQKPHTILDLSDKLKEKKLKIDTASIYRTLNLFVKLNIVHEVNFGDGSKRYELFEGDNHHHHLVCDKCGSVEDIQFDFENDIVKKAKRDSGFLIKRHSFEIFGICNHCLS